MNEMFNFKLPTIGALKRVTEPVIEKAVEAAEEWIWVEGYKGTDKNMRCKDYQYELGKTFIMPDDAKIKECSRGFHLCLNLKDVFNYYGVKDGNRFFKVKALVRKVDFENYGKIENVSYLGIDLPQTKIKLVSKSIKFISECSFEEVISSNTWPDDFTDEDKKIAWEFNWIKVKEVKRSRKLVECGYSEAFAQYIAISKDRTERAIAMADIPGLSMDVKVLSIFIDD